MRARFSQHQLRLIAALLLSLAGSLWLQGDHLHITDEHSVSEHCLVCQFGGAAAAAPQILFVFLLSSLSVLVVTALTFSSLASSLRPPSRAPPLF